MSDEKDELDNRSTTPNIQIDILIKPRDSRYTDVRAVNETYRVQRTEDGE